MEFEDYLNKISTETASSYIEHSQTNEMNYMQYGKERFKKYWECIPKDEKENCRILDIGTTPFTFYLQRSLPNYSVWTLDRTEHLKERCQKSQIELTAHNLDEETFPYEDNFFDVIVFTEVLEHIFASTSNILKEVNRILKPGGILILSVPNIVRLINRLRLVMGKTILEDPDEAMRKNFIHGHGHVHEFERKELTNIILNCGFTISRIEFLQRTILHAAEKHGTKNIIKASTSALYHTITAVLPSLRETILFVCKKQ